MLNHIGVIKYQMHVSTEAALIWYYDENFVQSYRVMIILRNVFQHCFLYFFNHAKKKCLKMETPKPKIRHIYRKLVKLMFLWLMLCNFWAYYIASSFLRMPKMFHQRQPSLSQQFDS